VKGVTIDPLELIFKVMTEISPRFAPYRRCSPEVRFIPTFDSLAQACTPQ
jgi:hypothetical protein